MVVSKSRLLQLALFVILILAFAIPRLVKIGSFATIDEPYWLTAGSDFYYALGQRAFANTVYDYHPAVTTMWIIAVGMLIYFPQYRGFGQGYFDVYKDTLEHFLLSHNHTPLGLLTISRIIQAIIVIILLVIVFWLIRRLLNEKIALVAALLISFDPFFLGHSRLLNHEGLLSLFNLICVLTLLIYLLIDRRLIYLILSGVAMGFAQLTKSSSIVMVGVTGFLFLFDIIKNRGENWKKHVSGNIAKLLIWIVSALAVYFIFWPGMWAAPGEMLYQVYGNAISYAFQGARLSVTGGIQPAEFQSPHLTDVISYATSILWRATPITWVGVILGVATIKRQNREARISLAAILFMGLLVVLLFGIANGRNSAHYVLSTYVALDVFAAVGWVLTADLFRERAFERTRFQISPALLGLVILIQIGSAMAFFPYYYTYYNPIMEALRPGSQNSNFGYGEVLEKGASYLSQQPNASKMTIVSYRGRGPFSYFFPGKTEELKNVYAEAKNVPELERVIQHSDYIVLYYEPEKRIDRPANVLRALENVTPEHVIWVNSIEYIRIYRVASLPPNFYKLLEP